MKVTKQQKVYAGLLVLGLTALVLDRCVFTPASADASDQASDLLIAKPAQSRTESPAPNRKATTTAPSGNPVALKLTELSESMHLPATAVKDAFSPAATWSGSGTTTAGGEVRNFEQTHTLIGVMVSGGSAAAMVDGKLVRVGQSIDGYKLISVSKGKAVFKSGEITATLQTR
jgi:hypothetical protein